MKTTVTLNKQEVLELLKNHIRSLGFEPVRSSFEDSDVDVPFVFEVELGSKQEDICTLESVPVNSTCEDVEDEADQDKKYVIYVQEWIEIEPGWGRRPDGYTLHPSKEHAKSYLEWRNSFELDYRNTHPGCDYSVVYGELTAYFCNEELYKDVVAKASNCDKVMCIDYMSKIDIEKV